MSVHSAGSAVNICRVTPGRYAHMRKELPYIYRQEVDPIAGQPEKGLCVPCAVNDNGMIVNECFTIGMCERCS